MKDSVSYKFANIVDYIYIPLNIIGIGGSIELYFHYIPHWVVLIPALAFLYFLVIQIKNLLDKSVQLSIGIEGIFLQKSGLLPWNNIASAEIEYTEGGLENDSTEMVLEVTLNKPDEKGNKNYSFDCMPLNINEEILRQNLKDYGRMYQQRHRTNEM